MPVPFLPPKSKATDCHCVITCIDLICVVYNVALKLGEQGEDTCNQIWQSAQQNILCGGAMHITDDEHFRRLGII